MEIHVTSDKLQAVTAEVFWELTDLAGNTISARQKEVEIPGNSNTLVETLSLADYVAEYGNRNLLLWLELKVDGRGVSDNLLTFCKPKHLELEEAEISYQVEKIADKSFILYLKAEKPALWTWLELQNYTASYSDNFSTSILARRSL